MNHIGGTFNPKLAVVWKRLILKNYLYCSISYFLAALAKNLPARKFEIVFSVRVTSVYVKRSERAIEIIRRLLVVCTART